MNLKGVRGKLDGLKKGAEGTQRETEAAQHGLALLSLPRSLLPEPHTRRCLDVPTASLACLPVGPQGAPGAAVGD